MLLHELLSFRARDQRRDAALICDVVELTFGELDERIERIASGLASLASPGDRVAILSENTVEYVECYYAVPRAGLVLTLINYRLHPDEVETLLQVARPTLLIAHKTYEEVARRIWQHIDSIRRLILIGDDGADRRTDQLTIPFDALREASSAQPSAVTAEDGAWLLYTSGTSGTPKAALLNHRNLLASVTNSSLGWGHEPGARLLFPWPMYHVAGYAILVAHLHGQPVHLLKRFDPELWLRTVEQYRITDVTIAPTMLNLVLSHPSAQRYDATSLRCVHYGSSVMPLAVLRRAMHHFPNARFRSGFGMTECSGIATHLTYEDHEHAVETGDESILQSVGRALPLTSVRVVDEALNDVAPGQVGEIALTGDQVIRTYWHGDASMPSSADTGPTAEWFQTGDLGRCDERGYLYVVDRKKDMIVTGGENVFSPEIEGVLYDHPSVAEAAVVGMPDEHWGERIVAVVQLEPDTRATAEELIDFCRGRLAGFKKPKEVHFVTAMPTNPSGKILKRVLRETLRGMPKAAPYGASDLTKRGEPDDH